MNNQGYHLNRVSGIALSYLRDFQFDYNDPGGYQMLVDLSV